MQGKLKMKKIIILILINFYSFLTYSQVIIKNQTIIPLNNNSWIPFSDGEMGDEKINGFDVDSLENYYFANAHNNVTTLAKFSDNKLVYRRLLSNLRGLIHIVDNKLYIFDSRTKQLYSFDKIHGTQNKQVHLNVIGNINSYRFVDTILVLDFVKVDTSGASWTYMAYNLKGQKIGKATNGYHLPPVFDNYSRSSQYLGRWNDYYLFWDYDDDSFNDKYWIADKNGKTVKQKVFNNKPLGHYFANPESYRKYLKGFIYVLGYKGKLGTISKLSVEELFK